MKAVPRLKPDRLIAVDAVGILMFDEIVKHFGMLGIAVRTEPFAHSHLIDAHVFSPTSFLHSSIIFRLHPFRLVFLTTSAAFLLYFSTISLKHFSCFMVITARSPKRRHAPSCLLFSEAVGLMSTENHLSNRSYRMTISCKNPRRISCVSPFARCYQRREHCCHQALKLIQSVAFLL